MANIISYGFSTQASLQKVEVTELYNSDTSFLSFVVLTTDPHHKVMVENPNGFCAVMFLKCF